MIIAVSGSRTIVEYKVIKEVLDLVHAEFPVTLLLHGGAKGVDLLACQWAKASAIASLEYKADWDKHGKAAGVIRSREMIDGADILVAVWDGRSNGTKHAIDYAQRTHKHTVIVNLSKEDTLQQRPQKKNKNDPNSKKKI